MKPAELVKYIQDQFFGSFEKTKFELFVILFIRVTFCLDSQ